MAGMTHKLTVNVPITMRIKYADEVTGEYGTQIRLKGAIEGIGDEVKAVYVPIDCAADLIAAGARRETNEKGAFYRPIAEGPWTVVKAQAAGEKHPTTSLSHGALRAPSPAPAGTPAADTPPLEEPEDTRPAPRTAVGRDTELVELFADCLKRVHGFANAANEKHPEGIQLTGDNVSTLTSTLYIARSRLVA